MITLKQDFPDTADAISTAAGSDAKLSEALRDYEQACERMAEIEVNNEERSHWAEIRAELVTEIRQIFLRTGQ